MTPTRLDAKPAEQRVEVNALHPQPVLTVRNLSVAPAKNSPAFLQNLSFELRPGEVLGFGGLMGAGRTELLMHLFEIGRAHV